MVGEALLRHLTSIGHLSDGDAEAVRRLEGKVRPLRRGCDILQIGDEATDVIVVMSGLLCRHSLVADGIRQIHSFYVATDAPCLETLHIPQMDHNLGAVCDSEVGFIPHAILHDVMDAHPKVRDLLWRETLIQSAIFRQWLIRNSRLPAHAAMANLFCEMYVRANVLDASCKGSFRLPASQEILGEALGLTAVHVNRTLQLLRQTGLADFRGGTVSINDFDALAEVGEFDPHYLHFRR